jgi:hypothetical protein
MIRSGFETRFVGIGPAPRALCRLPFHHLTKAAAAFFKAFVQLVLVKVALVAPAIRLILAHPRAAVLSKNSR